MELNTIRPASGSNWSIRRVGRGGGSGFGKTCGRGHKGQKSRSGGYHKVGFEGGQMPFQRRLPKRGFTSFNKVVSSRQVVSVSLRKILSLKLTDIDLCVLKDKKIISRKSTKVKLFMSTKVEKSINLIGIHVTKSLRAAIIAAGGTIR